MGPAYCDPEAPRAFDGARLLRDAPVMQTTGARGLPFLTPSILAFAMPSVPRAFPGIELISPIYYPINLPLHIIPCGPAHFKPTGMPVSLPVAPAPTGRSHIHAWWIEDVTAARWQPAVRCCRNASLSGQRILSSATACRSDRDSTVRRSRTRVHNFRNYLPCPTASRSRCPYRHRNCPIPRRRR